MLQRLRGYTPLNSVSSSSQLSQHSRIDDEPWPWETRRVKRLAAFGVVGAFMLYVLLVGLGEEARDAAERLLDDLKSEAESEVEAASVKPDFDQYIHVRTLRDEELPFGDPSNRVIVVGDVHGRDDSLAKLLFKLSYNSTLDTLIHAGDIVAKAPHSGSMAVLDVMTSHNITGVRGNHDQMVVAWRGWVERVLSHPKGRKWLEKLEKKGRKAAKKYLKGLKAGEGEMSSTDWRRFPGEWDFLGDHYKIARAMSDSQASYLRSLALVLHIPRLHAFVVHAGLLPLDPNRRVTSLRQPLAHAPAADFLPGEDSEEAERNKVGKMRTKQEDAVLGDIPQNRDPWVLLNMRSILNDNSISKDSKEGSPWAPLWNSIITRCGGFDFASFAPPTRQTEDEIDENDLVDIEDEANTELGDEDEGDDGSLKQKSLPCYPLTVIYGHAASRGLDIERWSKGLDTGCVYGRRLTALVLTPPTSSSQDAVEAFSDDDEDFEINANLVKGKRMHFGDKDGSTARAKVVSVSC